MVPYSLDTNDMRFFGTQSFVRGQDFADYVIDAFDWLHRESRHGAKMLSVGLHLRIIGRPGRIGAFNEFLRYAASVRGVWIATRRDIAEHYESVAED